MANLGEHIKNKLEENGISVTELKERLGLKSRNSIYRLFNNGYSQKKTEEMIKRIVKATGISEDELMLRTEGSEEKGFFAKARAVLMHLFLPEPEKGFKFTCENGTYALSDILKCSNDTAAVLEICGVFDMKAVGDLYEFLTGHPGITIYHYIRFRKRSPASAYELTALIMLMRCKNYYPMITDELPFRGIFLTEKAENGASCIRLEFMKKNAVYVSTHITNELCSYLENKRNLLIMSCTALRKPNKLVRDYIEMLEDSRLLDDGQIFYFEGAPCFGTLEVGIAEELLKKSGYMGFPKDHPYITTARDISYERYGDFMNSPTAKRHYVLDSEHMQNMLKTGLTVSHPESIPPLSREQLKRYFRWLKGLEKRVPQKAELRFTDIPKINYPFVYGMDKGLYVCHDESSLMIGFSITITAPAVIELMNDFAVYLWNSLAGNSGIAGILDEFLDS